MGVLRVQKLIDLFDQLFPKQTTVLISVSDPDYRLRPPPARGRSPEFCPGLVLQPHLLELESSLVVGWFWRGAGGVVASVTSDGLRSRAGMLVIRCARRRRTSPSVRPG